MQHEKYQVISLTWISFFILLNIPSALYLFFSQFHFIRFKINIQAKLIKADRSHVTSHHLPAAKKCRNWSIVEVLVTYMGKRNHYIDKFSLQHFQFVSGLYEKYLLSNTWHEASQQQQKRLYAQTWQCSLKSITQDVMKTWWKYVIIYCLDISLPSKQLLSFMCFTVYKTDTRLIIHSFAKTNFSTTFCFVQHRFVKHCVRCWIVDTCT